MWTVGLLFAKVHFTFVYLCMKYAKAHYFLLLLPDGDAYDVIPHV